MEIASVARLRLLIWLAPPKSLKTRCIIFKEKSTAKDSFYRNFNGFSSPKKIEKYTPRSLNFVSSAFVESFREIFDRSPIVKDTYDTKFSKFLGCIKTIYYLVLIIWIQTYTSSARLKICKFLSNLKNFEEMNRISEIKKIF